MKSYSAPRLVPVGSVVETTNDGRLGSEDPDNKTGIGAGSMGFNL
jgi:hypothetical protein